MNYTNSVDYTPFQNNTDRNLIVLENNREKKLNYIDNPEKIVNQYSIDNEEHAIDNGEHAIDNGEHSIDNREQDRINKLHRESISNHIMTINKDLDVIYRFLEKPKNKSIEETNCCSKNCIIL